MAGADGTAADKTPIANAPVRLSDSAGHSANATTDAQGYYRVNIKGFTPPFVAKVTRSDGTSWYSQSLAPVRTRGFVTVNLNGLTDKVAGYVAAAMNLGADASKATPTLLAASPSLLQASKDKLNAGLMSPLTYVGIDPVSFDPVGMPYQASGIQPYNKLLERLYPTKDNVTGNTVIVGNFAGATESSIDGPLALAGFKSPTGLAVDGNGNMFVADTGNHVIRKITPAGVVSTLAGSGIVGFADGIGPAATFNSPNGVAVDNSGNVFVADTGNHAIRRITRAGAVSTWAGNGVSGFIDGAGTTASFNAPSGVAVSSTGDVFVADTFNNAIRKITPNGIVSTFSGSGIAGFDNGTGRAASFNQPSGIAMDSNGNVFVADASNYAVRKITPVGAVSTFAGNRDFGFTDGVGTEARFNNPKGVALDSSGNVFVADTGNHGVRRISPSGVVSTLAGDGPVGLILLRPGRLTLPGGLAVGASGEIFVTGPFDSVIWILLQ